MDHIVVKVKSDELKRLSKVIFKTIAWSPGANNWKELGEALSVDDGKMVVIQADVLLNKISRKEAVKIVLGSWITHQGNNATVQAIINELRKIDWNNTADEVEEEFKPESKNNTQIHNDQVGLSTDEAGSAPDFKHTIPAVCRPYISRKLRAQNRLSGGILEDTVTISDSKTDLFVFSGIEESELCKFVKGRTFLRSKEISDTIQSLDSCIIHLSDEANWEKLRNKAVRFQKPIHLIKYDYANHTFIWIKSVGRLDIIRKYMHHDQSYLEEMDFIEALNSEKIASNHAILISDRPGMGKSELLAELGRLFQQKNPNHITLFLNAGHWFREINEKGAFANNNFNFEVIKESLQRRCCNNPAAVERLKTVWEKKAGTNSHLQLLLDGIDEIQLENKRTIWGVLTWLKEKQTIRLWITTRPHLLPKLENIFEVFGYTIQEFDEPQQIEFIEKYWTHKGKEPEPGVAKSCIARIKHLLGSSENYIAGVPLQCKLIADVCVSEADKIAHDEEFKPIGSITDLYDMYIAKKLTIYKLKFDEIENSYALKNSHILLALKYTFPEESQKFESLPLFKNVVSVKELLPVGIVSSVMTCSEPMFLHKTFAEYFIAEFVFWAITRENISESLLSFIFKKILSTERQNLIVSKFWHTEIPSSNFKHPNICYFLNSKLEISEPEGHSASKEISGQILEDEDLSALLHACFRNNTFGISLFLIRIGIVGIQNRHIFKPALLTAMVKCCSSEHIVRILKEQNIPSLSKEPQDGFGEITALHVAVERGNLSITHTLLETQGFRKLVEADDERVHNLLHCCVDNTRDETKNGIEDKIQILKIIVGIQNNLLRHKWYGRSPLVCNNVHVELLIQMINLGADISAVDASKNTVLHVAINHLTTSDFLKLARNIPEDVLQEMMKEKNEQSLTLLHLVCGRTTAADELLDFLQQNGADFNALDSALVSVLSCAVENTKLKGSEERKRVWDKLIHLGSDFKTKGNKTALHSAAQYGDMEAVKYFLGVGLDVNIEDNDEETPLDYAITGFKHYDGRLRVARFLLRHKAVYREDDDDIHERVKEGDVVGIRILLDILKRDVNQNDEGGDKPLHKIFEENLLPSEQQEIYHVLVQSKANVNAMNENQETPLYYGLRAKPSNLPVELLDLFDRDGAFLEDTEDMSDLIGNWIEIQTTKAKEKEENLLIQRCFSDNDGNTQLHRAANGGTSANVRSILENDSHRLINYKNSDGNTALHLAMYRSSGASSEIVELLLNNGADVNILNLKSQTPFIYSLSNGVNQATNMELFADRMKLLTSMVEERKFNLQIRDHNGETVLHYLAKSIKSKPNMMKLIDVFVAAGNRELFSITGGILGETPLHILCKKYMPKDLLQHIKSQNINLDCGDRDGETILMMALRNKMSKHYIQDLSEFCDLGVQDNEGNTTMHFAVMFGNKSVVKTFLDTDIKNLKNYQNKRGRTILHAAVIRLSMSDNPVSPIQETFKVIKKVIKQVADISIRDGEGKTFLHYAAQIAPTIVFKQILNLFEPEGIEPLLEGRDKFNRNVVFFAIMRTHNNEHEERDQIEMIKFLMVDQKLDIRQKESSRNLTVAHLAALRLTDTMFSQFISILGEENALDLFNVPIEDQDLLTPIHLAVRNVHMDENTLELLVNHGVNIKGIDSKGKTSLMHAIYGKRSCSILKSLRTFFDWEQKDFNEMNIIHHGVLSNSPATLKIILQELGEKTETLINSPDKDGHTPVHLSLICIKDSDPEDVADSKFEIVKILISSNAKLGYPDIKNWNALYFAGDLLCLKHAEEFINILSAKEYLHLFSQPSVSGITALQRTIIKKELDLKILELLHENGVNFNVETGAGDTLVSMAVVGGRTIPFIKKLVDMNVKWDTPNKQGRTILHTSCVMGNADALKFFLGLGKCNVDEADDSGNTPLHVAILADEGYELVKLLIENGANKYIPSKTGETAVEMANNMRDEVDPRILELLDD